MNITDIISGLVITEQIDAPWLLNFHKYNSEDDIEITEELGLALLDLKSKLAL